jgi:hypothetical protein
MAWTQIRVANVGRSNARRRRYASPSYEGVYYPHTGIFERKKGRRFWDVESVGGVSPAKARKSVARHKRKKAKKGFKIGNARRNNALTDLLAGDIASRVSKSVIGSLTRGRKKRPAKRKRRKNAGFRIPRQVSSIARAFSPSAAKKKYTQRRYKCVGGQKVPVRKTRKNPHLALIGGNPRRKTMAKARRRRRNRSLRGRPRDSKGRLLKVRNKRRKVSRRRRNTALTNPRRRRRRNRVRVVTKIKYRTRRVNVARKRRRKSTRRRSRRRNTVAAVNPRRRRRRRRNVAAVNPKRRRRRSRVTRRRRRRNSVGRRNAGIGGILGRLNLMQVVEVGIGTIAGDKLATWGGAKVASMVGVSDPMMTGLLKAGIGVAAAGFVSKFRPALALGLAVGAVNGLLNEYVFAPYISPYLPMAGLRGMGDYVDRTWKADNWLASGGAPGALAGMGNNSLNRSSL